MLRASLGRALGLILVVGLYSTPAVFGQDGMDPSVASNPDEALGAADLAVRESEKKKEEEGSTWNPTKIGAKPKYVESRAKIKKGERGYRKSAGDPATATASKPAADASTPAAKESFRDKATGFVKDQAKDQIKTASIDIKDFEGNARKVAEYGHGSTKGEVNVGHYEGSVSVGLENSVEAKVSAIEVKQQLGPAQLSADALTAKGGASIGLEGASFSAAAVLVEADGQLGPVTAGVGIGVSAEADFSLHKIGFKLGFGPQVDFSIDPLQAGKELLSGGEALVKADKAILGAGVHLGEHLVDDVGGFFGGLFGGGGHHKKKAPSPAPLAVAQAPAPPAVCAAGKGITGALQSLGE